MISGNNSQSGLPPLVESRTPACQSITRAIRELDEWITAELESLVEKHPDWQTTKANRKYFGR